MSKLTNGILGLLAASTAFGAVQLASGRDLTSSREVRQANDTVVAENIVNRDAKGDRAAVNKVSSTGQTLSSQTESASGTSILLRLPATETARNNLVPNAPRPAPRQSLLACEPVVSVLTAVAKHLPPGRCLT